MREHGQQAGGTEVLNRGPLNPSIFGNVYKQVPILLKSAHFKIELRDLHLAHLKRSFDYFL